LEKGTYVRDVSRWRFAFRYMSPGNPLFRQLVLANSTSDECTPPADRSNVGGATSAGRDRDPARAPAGQPPGLPRKRAPKGRPLTSGGASLRPDYDLSGVNVPEGAVLGGELELRRLGFGSMRLTGAGVWGEPRDRAGALALLREAIALGVNFVDTADSYGPAVSEDLIAEALYPYSADLVIATKGGFLRAGPWQWRSNGRPEHLRTACEGSLRRLRRERIDLYYLHTRDPAVPLEESVGCLAELRAEGKIRHVGLSNVGLDALRSAQAIVPISAVQNRYNLAERDHEQVLRVCEDEGIAFVPWFPLARGVLAGRRSRLLRQVGARRRATPAQVALAWLLHRSPAMIPIPGTSSVAHLRENVAAAGIELEEDDMAQLERFRAPMRSPAIVRRAAKFVLTRVPRPAR
jgi:pyridoxine 4-dehydrogenase